MSVSSARHLVQLQTAARERVIEAASLIIIEEETRVNHQLIAQFPPMRRTTPRGTSPGCGRVELHQVLMRRRSTTTTSRCAGLVCGDIKSMCTYINKPGVRR